jgi:uncharacterized repeat protein (TIGR02059 family)
MKHQPTELKVKDKLLNSKVKLPPVEGHGDIQVQANLPVKVAPIKSLRNPKKKTPQDDSETQELADGVAIGSGPQSDHELSNETQATGTLYAQLEGSSVVSDAGGSSSTVSTNSSNATAVEAGSTFTSGLSTGAMVALGLVGAGAIGAVIAANAQKNPDKLPPQVTSITAISANKTITLNYDEALDSTHLPLTSSFAITTNGIANTISSITVSGNTMTLTLTNAFTSGALTISYTDPTTGNDANAIQDTSGNDAGSFIQGIVADGYISGAQIYLDTNGNGIADPSEATGIYTNADGSFFLPNTLPSASIIAVGGTNIDTGLAQTTPLKAPAGSSTINPLTTLVAAVIDHAAQTGSPVTAASAAQTVASSLGLTLPTGNTLLNYDPLAQNDVTSLPVQKAAAQIATLIGLAAGSDATIAKTIMTNWAHNLLGPGISGVNLGDLDTIDPTELGILLANTNVTITPALITDIANANTAIQNATSFDQITSAQSQYLDTTAPAQISIRSSSTGIVKVQLDLAPLQINPDAWSYSTNNGTNWTPGVGDNFKLAVGTYNADQVQVKQVDVHNRETISKIAIGFSVAASNPPIDLLAMSGGGFKALTADSGMLAGLLKYYNTDMLNGNLNTANDVTVAMLLNDEMALSANSGSTWFLDLLGYSQPFVDSLNDYTRMFSKDGTYDLTTGGADGFFGVMGEAFNDYLDVSIADMWRDVQADFARINNFDSLLTFLSNAPETVYKMLSVACHGLGDELLDLLGTIPGVGPYINDLRAFFAGSFIGKISDAIDLMTLRGVDWNTFMQEIVFAPDHLATTLKNINFYEGTGRTSTLDTQSLIYTLTISSDEAAIGPGRTFPIADNTVMATVLNSEAQYEMLPSLPTWLSPTATYNFIPASATSLGNPTDIAAPWLPNIKSGDLRVEYDSSKLFDFGTIKTYDDLSFKGLSAYMTSTISSAAAGVSASYGALADTTSILGLLVNAADIITAGNFSDPLLNYTKGLSPLVQITQNANGPDIAYDPTLPSSTTSYADPITSISSSSAASNGFLRMADGGYFDNTGLEAGLSYLQANQSDWIAGDNINDFEITMFIVCDLDQVVSETLAARGFGNIGDTAERLFKDGYQFDISVLGVDMVDISHPNSAVFESASGKVSGMAAPIWTYASNATTGSGVGFKLSAWEIGVETFAGNSMNIGGGYKGTINYWAINSSTGAAPIASGNWNDYEIMYNQIITALQTEQTIAKYSAFGPISGAELLADHLGYTVLA